MCVLTSCATKITHGVILEEKNIARVMSGITRKEDVKNLIGNPSFVINDVWYYASTVKKHRAFFLPRVITHEVYVVSFADNTVVDTKHLAEKDIQNTAVPIYKIKTIKPDLKKIYNAN